MNAGPPSPVADRLDAVLDLLEPLEDILTERVVTAEGPRWCRERGWDAFLLGMDEAALLEAERAGLPFAEAALRGAPPSLRELCARLRPIIEGTLGEDAAPLSGPLASRTLAKARHLRPHKRTQIEALTELCRARLRKPQRAIELGAGHGHLGRWLGRELELSVIGLERDPERVKKARKIATEELEGTEGLSREAAEGGVELGRRLRFVAEEVSPDGDLPLHPPLGPADLLLGLHACGGLGDALIWASRRSGAAALLVSCCLQKISGPAREAVSSQGAARGFSLPRVSLGLTNLAYTGDPLGMAKTMQKLLRRHALRLLLLERGLDLGPRDEAHGVHRRDFERSLRRAADRALAHRGLPAASDEELRRASARAEEEHARIRRLSLPRCMLGRVVELAIVLDRARALEETGREVWVGPAFSATHSPRNLGILAGSVEDACF